MLASHSKFPLSNKGHNLRGQMNLPIQKYEQYCEQQYAKNQNLEAGTSEFDEKWSVEFERLKEQLVMERDFVAVSSER